MAQGAGPAIIGDFLQKQQQQQAQQGAQQGAAAGAAAGQRLNQSNSMSMQNDWQRLYDELNPGGAPITAQQYSQRPMPQAQPLPETARGTPTDGQAGSQVGQMAVGALLASDPQTKIMHDELTRQFATAAEPIAYEYKPEYQEKFGLSPGVRQGVDARRIAEEGGPLGRQVTSETPDGLKVIKEDEGTGLAMSLAAKAEMETQQQRAQMKRMMEALDRRMLEQEMRNRMRSKV